MAASQELGDYFWAFEATSEGLVKNTALYTIMASSLRANQSGVEKWD
jgi:hypothetical protein